MRTIFYILSRDL